MIINGDLVPTNSSDGTPVTVRAKGEDWENEARENWLKESERLEKQRETADALAIWMEEAADKWKSDHPKAHGGELDYQLRRQAKDIRHLGVITKEAKDLAIEAGWSDEEK